MTFCMEASTPVLFSCDVGGGLVLISIVTSLEVLVVMLRFPVVALHPSFRPVLWALYLLQVEEVACLDDVTLGASGTHVIALSLDKIVQAILLTKMNNVRLI